MRYSDDIIEEVRMKNDIVDVISQYVKLTRRGSSYFGLCPFHNEKTPSFSVTPSKQMYYCFGCGAGGNVYNFIMEYENYSFGEALSHLADRAGVELPKIEYSREAREKAGLSRNDLGDKVFYGERHIADIENIGKHPSFQLFHDLVTMFNISVDEYFYPAKNVEKNTARRQIDSSLDLLSDNELKIIQGTIDGILNSRENKK